MLGSNLKVHFAGLEQSLFAECALDAGVRYALFTVFGFICEKFGLKRFPDIGVEVSDKITILKKQMSQFNHSIMDSGLFTLMFGSEKGKRDKKFITSWLESICEFVLTNDIRSTCVECDCQKVLGVEAAWEMRERMRMLLPDRKIINVFHHEDGRRGLDRLIEFSDYIAISVPEMRIIYGTGEKYKDATERLAHYVKSKKPEIDIHLLGCTSLELLKRCKFCTSSDSTSWQQGNRYGVCRFDGKMRHISTMKQKPILEISGHLEKRLEVAKLKRVKNMEYLARYVIFARLCKMDYELAAGSQE